MPSGVDCGLENSTCWQLLLINKCNKFTRSLFHKLLIGNVKNTKFLDKLSNLLVILNSSKTKYGIRIIFKYAIGVA